MDNCVEVNSDICENLQLAWRGDYSSLKRFESQKLQLVGEWDQPSGDKKVFTGGNTSISWRRGIRDLQFSDKDAENMACLMICTENVNNTKSANSSSIAIITK